MALSFVDWHSPAQGLGYLAFVLAVFAFLQRSDVMLKRWMLLQSLVYALHFALLGAWVAVFSLLLAVLRLGLSLRTRSCSVMLALMALTIGLSLLLTRSWLDALPIAASLLATYALFRCDGATMRWVLLASSLLWLVHNMFVGSIGGLALEVAITLACLVTLWRMRFLPAPIGPAPTRCADR